MERVQFEIFFFFVVSAFSHHARNVPIRWRRIEIDSLVFNWKKSWQRERRYFFLARMARFRSIDQINLICRERSNGNPRHIVWFYEGIVRHHDRPIYDDHKSKPRTSLDEFQSRTNLDNETIPHASSHRTLPFTAIGRSNIPCIPRIADWGGLIIGVPNNEPNTPPLLMVNVPPSISSMDRFPFFA